MQPRTVCFVWVDLFAYIYLFVDRFVWVLFSLLFWLFSLFLYVTIYSVYQIGFGCIISFRPGLVV